MPKKRTQVDKTGVFFATLARICKAGQKCGIDDLTSLIAAHIAYPPLKKMEDIQDVTGSKLTLEQALKRHPVGLSRFICKLNHIWKGEAAASEHSWTDALIVQFPNKTDAEIAALDAEFRGDNWKRDKGAKWQQRVRRIEKRRERLAKKSQELSFEGVLLVCRIIKAEIERLNPEDLSRRERQQWKRRLRVWVEISRSLSDKPPG